MTAANGFAFRAARVCRVAVSADESRQFGQQPHGSPPVKNDVPVLAVARDRLPRDGFGVRRTAFGEKLFFWTRLPPRSHATLYGHGFRDEFAVGGPDPHGGVVARGNQHGSAVGQGHDGARVSGQLGELDSLFEIPDADQVVAAPVASRSGPQKASDMTFVPGLSKVKSPCPSSRVTRISPSSAHEATH